MWVCVRVGATVTVTVRVEVEGGKQWVGVGGGVARGAEGGACMRGWGARAGRAPRACGVSAAVPRAGETSQQAICRSKGVERVKGR